MNQLAVIQNCNLQLNAALRAVKMISIWATVNNSSRKPHGHEALAITDLHMAPSSSLHGAATGTDSEPLFNAVRRLLMSLRPPRCAARRQGRQQHNWLRGCRLSKRLHIVLMVYTWGYHPITLGFMYIHHRVAWRPWVVLGKLAVDVSWMTLALKFDGGLAVLLCALAVPSYPLRP